MTGQNTTNISQPAGPIAQQLTHIQQSNGHKTLMSSQQQVGNQLSKRVNTKEVRDWLNVLGVFLIPLMIGVFTVANNVQQNKISQQQYDNSVKAANTSHQADIALQTDQQRETALASYIRDMKDLISTEGLQTSKLGSEVRVIARAQTLIILRQLDGTRKGIVMQFLSEAELILEIGKIHNATDVVIDLSGADLSGADLRRVYMSGAHLFNAHLSGAHLSGANLSNTYLSGADLSGAYLRNASLGAVVLDGASLSNSDLISAHLTYTDQGSAFHVLQIGGANLSGANLVGADITQQQVNQTTTCKDTMSDSTITHSQEVCKHVGG